MKELQSTVAELRDDMEGIECRLVDFALSVAKEQAMGKSVSDVDTAEIINTVQCYLGGECQCFTELVEHLMEAAEEAEEESKTAYDKAMSAMVNLPVRGDVH